MHLGHLTPFLFTKYLQEAFNVPLVVQITDDEKFLFKDITQDQMERLARENIRDIIALGFDREKTFIFQDYHYMGHMYRLVSRIQKTLTASQVRGCFGFKGEDNIGKWSFCAIQAAPSFPDCFPHIFGLNSKAQCLIPCAIDQDPYFRLTRDMAPKLKYQKPALIHSKFFPALTGNNTKMSGSVSNSSILLTDTPKMIKDKIGKSFTGGGATKPEQFLLGANCEVDIPIQWLSFFWDDDEKLEKLKKDYARGRALTGDVKKVLIDIITDLVTTHQKKRKDVTEEMIDSFMAVRPMGPMLAKQQAGAHQGEGAHAHGHGHPKADK
jgi:tryptophanyl-tRNA synthetase